jgi:hypothetical protein
VRSKTPPENLDRIDTHNGRRYDLQRYNQVEVMTPKKTVTLADDVQEQLALRAEVEGRDLDELANEAMRLGLGEAKWQRLVKRGRNYSREMAEATTDEEAIQIAVDAVHEHRAEQRDR